MTPPLPPDAAPDAEKLAKEATQAFLDWMNAQPEGEEFDERFGPVPEEELAESRADLEAWVLPRLTAFLLHHDQQRDEERRIRDADMKLLILERLAAKDAEIASLKATLRDQGEMLVKARAAVEEGRKG